jgi:hypothetical protein
MTKHIHKYHRIRLGKNRRIEYKCAIPGCVHHIVPELALGRESICWTCGEAFFLDKLALQLAKPHHRECGKKNNNRIKILEMIR